MDVITENRGVSAMTWRRAVRALRRARRRAAVDAATSRRGSSRPGGGSWSTLLVGGLAVAVGLVGTLGGDGQAEVSTAAPRSASTGCAPSAERAGPLVDLSVDLSPRRRGTSSALSDEQLGVLLGLADAAGADVLSTTVSFDHVQPRRRGPLDWSRLDRFVGSAEAAGLDVRVRLQATAAWALNPDKPGSAARPPQGTWELLQWSQLVDALARRYDGRLDYLEVWSGPDDFAAWGGPPDAAAYARLLRATFDAVDARDPDVRVVTGGLTGNDVGYLQALYDALALHAGAGARRPFDLVGVQAYDGDLPPSAAAVGDADRSGTERSAGVPVAGRPADTSLLGVRDLLGAMAANGDRDPGVYVTGYGYRTRPWLGADAVSDEQRAGYLTDALGLLTCVPSVAAVSLYFQPTTGRDASWTLLDDALTPSASYRALVSWSARSAALRAGATAD